jgi:hypothetical protein
VRTSFFEKPTCAKFIASELYEWFVMKARAGGGAGGGRWDGNCREGIMSFGRW